MRRKINNYFIGGLLENAKAFDVARIKLVYNFTLFYYIMNLVGCFGMMANGSYVFAIVGGLIAILFTTGILVFLRRQKLTAAILTYFAMHLVIGNSIFFINKGDWSVMDGGMIVVLIVFALLTMGRKWGLAWAAYTFVIIGVGLAHEYSGGRVLTYESPGMPDDPTVMIYLPCLLVIYILWVYLKSKEYAETQIQTQQEQLAYQHLQITDSISYARRLQEAILPVNMNELLRESFVLFKPKEIVSGDFYWAEQVNATTLFAVADCTGHGVPGAMVSMVGNNGLNKCVKELELTRPAEILDQLSIFVEETFAKSKQEVKDGMDIALCALQGNTLHYAGANNPLYYIRKGELHEIKSDKQPIGHHTIRQPYTHHSLDLTAGDCLYVFSDGFADQFGGPEGKKFKYKPFKELLLANHGRSMDAQKQILEKAFEDWKGSLEQVDDICIIGVRIG